MSDNAGGGVNVTAMVRRRIEQHESQAAQYHKLYIANKAIAKALRDLLRDAAALKGQ